MFIHIIEVIFLTPLLMTSLLIGQPSLLKFLLHFNLLLRLFLHNRLLCLLRLLPILLGLFKHFLSLLLANSLFLCWFLFLLQGLNLLPVCFIRSELFICHGVRNFILIVTTFWLSCRLLRLLIVCLFLSGLGVVMVMMMVLLCRTLLTFLIPICLEVRNDQFNLAGGLVCLCLLLIVERDMLREL